MPRELNEYEKRFTEAMNKLDLSVKDFCRTASFVINPIGFDREAIRQALDEQGKKTAMELAISWIKFCGAAGNDERNRISVNLCERLAESSTWKSYWYRSPDESTAARMFADAVSKEMAFREHRTLQQTWCGLLFYLNEDSETIKDIFKDTGYDSVRTSFPLI